MLILHFLAFKLHALCNVDHFLLYVVFLYIWTDIKNMWQDLRTGETFSKELRKSVYLMKVPEFIVIQVNESGFEYFRSFESWISNTLTPCLTSRAVLSTQDLSAETNCLIKKSLLFLHLIQRQSSRMWTKVSYHIRLVKDW